MNAIRQQWAEQFGTRNPKVICVGLNYREHAAEGGQAVPPAPLLFGKFANTLCADGDAIILPPGIGHVDAEAELGVVIGRTARSVHRDDAFDFVAGYCCANDVSAREAQDTDGQWFRGKGYDTFCPVGPEVVPLTDPTGLRIIQRLNGHILQDSTTDLLIFDIPELIEYASRVVTLEKGDLLLTGTPAGVGVVRNPKISLERGDVVEVEITSIGTLTNPVY